MSRIPATLFAAILAGCSAHASLRLGPGAGSVSAGLSVHSGAGALAAIGALAVATRGEESRAVGPRPWLAIDAPPLEASRRVNEQDCTVPIADRTANLRCR